MTRIAPPLRELFLPLVDAALAEDVGSGDATTLAVVPAALGAEGEILAKAEGVLAGLPVAREVFLRVDPNLAVELDAEDGDRVRPGQTVARIRGRARGILTAERTALNFLQHLSGIATATSRLAGRLEGTPTRLLDTRKTVPALRHLAKYAVRCGGGENHRQGLYDMLLIKENHIAAAGSVTAALTRARATVATDVLIEIEVENLDQLHEALGAGATRILLDNFDLERLAAAVRATAGRATLEASGGVTLDNIRAIAETGVDFISVGSLTKHLRAIDLSMRFLPH